MNWKIMWREFEVAKTINDPQSGFRVFKTEGIDPFKLPIGLFKVGEDSCSYTQFKGWLSKRAFPPSRDDASKLLAELGLTEYNIIPIIEKTRGSLATDDWWIKVNPSDDFYRDTLRGICIQKGLIK